MPLVDGIAINADDKLSSPDSALRPQKSMRKRLVSLTAVAVAIGIVFCCCLRLASTIPTDSDGAGNILMAWAMLHGNVLLSGWRLTDVSFYLTELPEYMLITAVRGVRPDVVQIGAAITYTLCALGAALVAKGEATGRAGALRAALAIGIALAPAAGDQRTLLTNPDHTGTAVPILLLLLLLERPALRARMPLITLVIVSVAAVSDEITLLIAVAPLVGLWLLRSRLKTATTDRADRVDRRLERRLAVAACAAAVIGWAATQVIKAVGGWRTVAIPATFVGFGRIAGNFRQAIAGLLTLFNIGFAGQSGWHTTLAVFHLIGLLLVVAAVVLGIRGIRAGDDLVTSLLTLAILVDLAAFSLFISSPQQNYREIDVIVPLGAALAGRVLVGPLPRMRMQWAVAAVLAAFAVTFGYGLTQATRPPANLGLGNWLVEHHLTSGIAEYWAADTIVADTGGAVHVVSVQLAGGRLTPNLWETDTQWFNPGTHYANFLILSAPSGSDPHPMTRPEAVTALGTPSHAYSYAGDVILVWQKNLLTLVSS
jgi:hypothetical protein